MGEVKHENKMKEAWGQNCGETTLLKTVVGWEIEQEAGPVWHPLDFSGPNHGSGSPSHSPYTYRD